MKWWYNLDGCCWTKSGDSDIATIKNDLEQLSAKILHPGSCSTPGFRLFFLYDGCSCVGLQSINCLDDGGKWGPLQSHCFHDGRRWLGWFQSNHSNSSENFAECSGSIFPMCLQTSSSGGNHGIFRSLGWRLTLYPSSSMSHVGVLSLEDDGRREGWR